MGVAPLGAITSTTMIVLPSVPIMSWRPEKLAMEIVPKPATMASLVRRIASMEALRPAVPPAFLPTFCFAKIATGAAQLAEKIITTTTAVPIAVITSLRTTKSVTAIAPPHAMMPILARTIP
jgi:hypothetical protein